MIGAIFASLWGKLVLAGAAVLAVGAVLLSARNAGKAAARVEAVEATIKKVSTRHENERAIRSADADERERLRRKWTRGR